MRLTLADTGDPIEDSNFEEEMAEAQLLCFYTFIEWMKEVLDINSVDIEEEDDDSKNSSVIHWIKDKLHLSSNLDNINEEFIKHQNINYRTDTKYNHYDHVFESEINREIQLTEENYKKIEQMNLHLIKRFIEVQVILLVSICPHICDYVCQFLHPSTTIMNAKWPTAGKVDQSSLRPTHTIIFIAHSYPSRNDITSLDQYLSFDEYEILQLNQNYLRRTLNVEQLDIRLTDDNNTDTTMLNYLEDIVPDKPFVHLRH
ncbi:unnamed protein product [Rotaria sordida]|uniref:Uncharacterized protein n=1 Tax=Rotaria sordida TaxID=392033 RepID=A0A815MK96_9BILA|nr:unnamed protein product [Rotaria sordida]CAF4054380.1 unnamed protein product [Rotaria sordida]